MKSVSLNQFGSIVSFAIEIEKKLEKYYSNHNLSENFEDYVEEFRSRAKSSKKRARNLERSRRENVTEITLEPIEGLDSNDYLINTDDFNLNTINSNELKVIQFYKDANPKINVLETQRLFKRCLKDHLNLQLLK